MVESVELLTKWNDTMDMEDDRYMREALAEAHVAASEEEVPVGAVIVRDGLVIARGRNMTRTKHCPTSHAEMIAIEAAANATGNERLTGCDLYVTKEPCAMCAGAIVHARIRRVIIGTPDTKAGACGSVLDVCGNERLNHRPQILFGPCSEESARLLGDFFKGKRRKTPHTE